MLEHSLPEAMLPQKKILVMFYIIKEYSNYSKKNYQQKNINNNNNKQKMST